MSIRRPVAAGTFYPSKSSDISKFCKSCLSEGTKVARVKAVILPHAGYVYSGKTACIALDPIYVPERVFLMGPNHQGVGYGFALYAHGAWDTPLGMVPVNENLSGKILKEVPAILEDHEAHLHEHSLEVIVPLLQMKQIHLSIVPLTVGATNWKKIKETAELLGQVLAGEKEDCLIAVSTDMNHFDSDEVTRKKDRYALDAILNLDADALQKVVTEHHISMCGFIPVTMLLWMAAKLGISKASLADYRTSADQTGDKDRVVGYASFIFD